MVDPQEAAAWVVAGKSALDLLRSALQLLPTGKAKDDAAAKLAEAEAALKRSDAKLAIELGYKLCHCTFPPSIMLWKEQEEAHECQNPECRRKIERPRAVHVSHESSWIKSRRGS
jgi:hypothetical protein